MPVKKLNGPLGGDYQTDGSGNAVLLNSYPLTDEDNVPSVLASQGARVTAAENTSRKVLGNTLAATLSNAQNSLAVQVLGDSTGNETTEWVYLLGADIAAAYPAYEVRYYAWDFATETMPYVPITIHAAPNSARRVTWNGAQHSRKFAASSVTGDLDVRIKCEMADWNNGIASFICGQFFDGTHRSWRLYKSSGGFITFDWSTDGTNLQTAVATGYRPPAATPTWFRVVLDVDNGASGHDIKFYSSTDGATYSQVGSTVTRASTTSIYNNTAVYEIGARGFTTEPFTGSVYEVQILAGIAGYAVTPCLPEHWDASSTSAPEPSGDPILTAMNGSHSGAGVSYLDGGIVLERMTPNYGTAVAIISTSHNEIGAQGASLFAAMSAYVASIRARIPGVPLIAVTQNPRISPAANINAQSQRRTNYMAWETELGWTVIDTYGAFLADGRAMSLLVSTGDGIHPTAAGSVVWKNAIKAALGLA